MERAMSLAMTRQEREAFLADVHVGIISIPEPGQLTVPVWYSYEPGGELRLVTGRTSSEVGPEPTIGLGPMACRL
jgi:hypothetical protein